MPNMTAPEIADVADLRSRYREPTPAVLHKARPVVDPAAADLIAASPFVVVATTSDGGTDASPRGGPPGFVVTLDEHTIAFGDLAGNNRLDSYANIVEHPAVGLLFLVPGLEETLRVNGQARITTDPAVLDRTAVDGRRPKVAVVVDVDECYIHCGKAVRRSGIWDSSTWPAEDERPTAGEVIVSQFSLEVDPALIDADLDAGYRETLWEQGGT
jgi:PPOX class probable FMN-dependent enzyme